MNGYAGHFIKITKHKWVVMKLCFKCGLYRRGLLHDLSKYGVTEFASSARYFQGDRSPIEAEKDATGYSIAWQHHKGHNPHHWEYWVDNIGTRQNDAIRIPTQYVIEMICDWVSAGIVYSGNKPDYDEPYDEPLEYYKTHLHERIFHPVTQRQIEHYLTTLYLDGINAFCREAKGHRNEIY